MCALGRATRRIAVLGFAVAAASRDLVRFLEPACASGGSAVKRVGDRRLCMQRTERRVDVGVVNWRPGYGRRA